ncbi:hypothetical protein FHT32_006989 [Variovorax sp. SG517]|nr:hypothetical protein [Variovorax sp. SG517]
MHTLFLFVNRDFQVSTSGLPAREIVCGDDVSTMGLGSLLDESP